MRYLIIFFIGFIMPLQGMAQYEQYLQKDDTPPAMRQFGAAFSVLENGTGVGVFYKTPLPWLLHVGVSTNFYFLRDSKQVQYIDPYDYYEIPITINKKNNAYFFDLLFSLKKRLFAYTIDDSFQPYISVSAGPVYGMNYPEPDPKVEKRPNEFGWAMSGMGALGVDAIIEGNYIFGVRFQYRYIRFDQRIGEKQDHSTFDLRIELGKQF